MLAWLAASVWEPSVKSTEKTKDKTHEIFAAWFRNEITVNTNGFFEFYCDLVAQKAKSCAHNKTKTKNLWYMFLT